MAPVRISRRCGTTAKGTWPPSRCPSALSWSSGSPGPPRASSCGERYADGVSTARHLEAVGSENQLTIEELAGQTGMTVRNIRSHQARGLLAPPEVRSRVGYYGPEHVVQLRLIRELQDEGFNLNGIKRLLEETDGNAERLLRVRQSLTESAGDAPAETHTAIELGARFQLDPAEGR